MTTGAAVGILGLLWTVLWRWGHDSGLLFFGGATTWPAAPLALRHVARDRDGEVNIFALANEIWGVVVVGLGIWLHVVPPDTSVSSIFTGLGLSLLIPAGTAGIYAAFRHWRGSP